MIQWTLLRLINEAMAPKWEEFCERVDVKKFISWIFKLSGSVNNSGISSFHEVDLTWKRTDKDKVTALLMKDKLAWDKILNGLIFSHPTVVTNTHRENWLKMCIFTYDVATAHMAICLEQCFSTLTSKTPPFHNKYFKIPLPHPHCYPFYHVS